MSDDAPIKDVFSINELDQLNRLLQDSNEFLVEREYSERDEDVIHIEAYILVMRDSTGKLFGSLTKWSRDDDVKFEPRFIPDLVTLG